MKNFTKLIVCLVFLFSFNLYAAEQNDTSKIYQEKNGAGWTFKLFENEINATLSHPDLDTYYNLKCDLMDCGPCCIGCRNDSRGMSVLVAGNCEKATIFSTSIPSINGLELFPDNSDGAITVHDGK